MLFSCLFSVCVLCVFRLNNSTQYKLSVWCNLNYFTYSLVKSQLVTVNYLFSVSVEKFDKKSTTDISICALNPTEILSQNINNYKKNVLLQNP